MMKLSKYFDISSKNKSLKNILNNIFLYSFTSSIQPYKNNREKIFAQTLHFLHLTTFSHTSSIHIKQQTRRKLGLSDFRLDVVRALLEELGIQKLDVRGRPSIETPVRITARYFPSKVQSSEDGRRRCFVCSHTTSGPKREIKTSYECKECNVGLCVAPCFEAYHTLKHF